MLGSLRTGAPSLVTGEGSVLTAAGVCAPYPDLFLTDGASFKTATEGVLTAAQPPACSCTPSNCFRIQPVIANTVVMCPFQGSLADISGNNLSPIMNVGAEAYGAIGPCLQGFRFKGETPQANDLIFPSSPLLDLTGEHCFEFVIHSSGTFVQTFFQIEPGPEVAWFINGAINLAYTDEDGAETLLPALDWLALTTAGVPFYMQLRKKLTAPGAYELSCWINGIKVATSTTGVNTTRPLELLRMGGFTGGPNLNATVGNFRLQVPAPTDAEMLEHYEYVVGCA